MNPRIKCLQSNVSNLLASKIDELEKKVLHCQSENFKILGDLEKKKRENEESNLKNISSSLSEVHISELQTILEKKGKIDWNLFFWAFIEIFISFF